MPVWSISLVPFEQHVQSIGCEYSVMNGILTDVCLLIFVQKEEAQAALINNNMDVRSAIGKRDTFSQSHAVNIVR